MSTDRYVDLLKQGFMRAAFKTPRPKKAKRTVEIVTCEACQDWHPERKHTKSKDQRKPSRKQTIVY